MKTSLFIARRLSFKPDDKNTKSPAITIASTGIALSFIIMLFAISIVTGFKNQITAKINGFESQILVLPSSENDGLPGISLSDNEVKAAMESLPDGAVINIGVIRPAILKTDENFTGLVIKSFPKELSFLHENITDGSITDISEDKNSVVISSSTAKALGISKPGEKLYANFITENNVKTRKLTVSAIFDTHFSDFDENVAYASLALLQSVAKLPEERGTILEINGLASDKVTSVSEQIEKSLTLSSNSSQRDYEVTNIYQTGAIYFNWLDLLNTNVTVILLLMAAVAGFSLVSSTFIIILERVNTIGLLKALGMTNSEIRSIFIYMSQRLVIKGLAIGNIVGITLLLLQKLFRLIPLNPNAYFIDYVPVDLNIFYILLLNAGVIIVAGAMLLLPARAIGRMNPADSLRFA